MHRNVIMQTLDLFRTVFIHENGIEELCLPELTDIQMVCRTVFEMAEERKRYYKEREKDETD